MNVELMSTILNWTSRPEDVEALSCEYCNEVMKNPQRLPCGHSFCNPCVPNLKKKCAICGRDFKKEHVSKDILAFNLIEELMLKCDHGSCLWQGTFIDYQTHLKKVHLKSPAKEDLIKTANAEENIKRVKSADHAEQDQSLENEKESFERSSTTPMLRNLGLADCNTR
jgi:hypothetical protein